ncbi:phosphomannomutase [Palleronia sediminis]|uniref:Phosphomannomutase n=1 Tax=Palleronia sediminis TaxID=2547833 RepID=A0A4R6AEC6_9RHOB|nr:phosphomannomutase [Palleronia sediminis]TDL81587.1 phosphomannomutase [Palleronia sediminis]
MAPKFGTSGLRGLVTELTDALVADYTRAFLSACDTGGRVLVGRDLRPSSPRIEAAVIAAARGEGAEVIRCGEVPTPALALAAQDAGGGAIMITGSHIPADRNGLKFYDRAGEIAKPDEIAITAALGRAAAGRAGRVSDRPGAGAAWADRVARGFGPAALAGLRLGVWQHSSVARDLLGAALEAMGAEVVALDRSDGFVPVDTEAVDAATRDRLAAWVDRHGLDALVSTDGDGDRPLVVDGLGRVVPGDILGPLTARAIGARRLVTPVSSNTAVEAMGFDRVERTAIGSPHVIAGMEGGGAVAGYEANGGFLLGFAAEGPAGRIAPLMTRDCLLPIAAPLAAARAAGRTLAETVAALPQRFTMSDRVQDVPAERSQPFLARLIGSDAERRDFLGGVERAVDLTDGLRITLASGDIVHLRPSGNAPEFRIYAEAGSPAAAEDLVRRIAANVAARLKP